MIIYTWIYDTDLFDAASPVNQPQIKLIIKAGKSFDAIVSAVTCQIVDTDSGCTSIKTCYMTPDGMICDDTYVGCPNPRGLVLINKIVRCTGPSQLQVSKKV